MCKPLQKSNMLNEFIHKYKAKHTHTTAAAQSFMFWCWMQVDWAPTPVAYYFLLALTRRPTLTKWSVMNRSTPKVSKEITAPSLENTWVTFLFRVCSPLPFVFVAFVSSMLACKTLSSCCPDSHRKSVKWMREWKNDFLAQFIAFEVWSFVHRVKLINFLIVFPLLNFQWWSLMWNWF